MDVDGVMVGVTVEESLMVGVAEAVGVVLTEGLRLVVEVVLRVGVGLGVGVAVDVEVPVLVLDGDSLTLGVSLMVGVLVTEGVTEIVGVGDTREGFVRVNVHPVFTTVPSVTHFRYK